MSAEYSPLAVKRSVTVRELVSFFCKTHGPGFVFKGETHNFWEFVIILEGRAIICSDNKIFELEKGQAVWHKPNEFHSVKAIGDGELRLGVFSFYGSVNFPASKRYFTVPSGVPELFEGLRREADGIFEFNDSVSQSAVWIKSLKPNMELDMQMLVSQMEYLLSSVLKNGDKTLRSQKFSASEENYLRIVEVIRENLYKRKSVSELARLCNMSTSNAKRVFARYAGCGISAYYNEAVVSEAEKMLLCDKSVGEISRTLGFVNQNYFSSFFKRITGKTPLEWKREHSS